MSENFDGLRQAGAARHLLVAAAAARWGVPAETCRTELGSVIHDATGRRLGYGALAAEAARLTVPENVPLKPRSALPTHRYPGPGHRSAGDRDRPGDLRPRRPHTGHAPSQRAASAVWAPARVTRQRRRGADPRREARGADRSAAQPAALAARRGGRRRLDLGGDAGRAGAAGHLGAGARPAGRTARRSGPRCIGPASPGRAGPERGRREPRPRPGRPGWSRRPTSSRSWPTCRWSRSTASPMSGRTGRGLGSDAGPGRRAGLRLESPDCPTRDRVHMTRSGGGFGRRLISDYGAEAATCPRRWAAGAGAVDPRRGPEPGLLSSLRGAPPRAGWTLDG